MNCLTELIDFNRTDQFFHKTNRFFLNIDICHSAERGQR